MNTPICASCCEQDATILGSAEPLCGECFEEIRELRQIENMNQPSNTGAPNSIARYVTSTNFGDNAFATFEYEAGMPVVRAAGTYGHCMEYMADGRCIVDVKRIWIVWPMRDKLAKEIVP